MMRWLWRLTGGRPMERIQYLFTDSVVGREVNLYRDRLGRHWMAFTAWSISRVER